MTSSLASSFDDGSSLSWFPDPGSSILDPGSWDPGSWSFGSSVGSGLGSSFGCGSGFGSSFGCGSGFGSAFGRSDGWVVVPGSRVTVELVTDFSVQSYGYHVNAVAAYY